MLGGKWKQAETYMPQVERMPTAHLLKFAILEALPGTPQGCLPGVFKSKATLSDFPLPSFPDRSLKGFLEGQFYAHGLSAWAGFNQSEDTVATGTSGPRFIPG